MNVRFNKTQQHFLKLTLRSLHKAQLRARNNLEIQFNPFLVKEDLANIRSELSRLAALLGLTTGDIQ